MDLAGFLQRLKTVLPQSWFGDTTPVLDSVLSGLAVPPAFCQTQLQSVAEATRIATASGAQLDLVAADFFGTWLARLPAELDWAFRTRIQTNLLPLAATRGAVTAALAKAGVEVVRIFEPARPADTGAYAVGSAGYGLAGGWGSLSLPYQVFLDLRQTSSGGVASIAGYGTGGGLSYQAGAQLPAVLDDQMVAKATTRFIPAATIAWIRLA